MRLKPQHLLIAIVIVVLIPLLYLASDKDQPGMKRQEGDVIIKNVSAIEGDATASFQIALKEGGDPVHESDHVFQSVEFPSVQSVSLNTKTLLMEVRYDSSQVDEAALRQSLVAAGYLVPDDADATAATVAADGSSQQIEIKVGSTLEPALFKLTAGVPAKITFSPGSQHLASITIPELGIQQDLTGGATVEIDDPKPGSYSIICAEGVADGTFIVK